MTRLNWIKIGDELHSKKDIMCCIILVKVIIHKPSLKYIVIAKKNGKILREGNATTLKGLKKRVKRVLMELGANFTDELRGRKFELE